MWERVEAGVTSKSKEKALPCEGSALPQEEEKMPKLQDHLQLSEFTGTCQLQTSMGMRMSEGDSVVLGAGDIQGCGCGLYPGGMGASGPLIEAPVPRILRGPSRIPRAKILLVGGSLSTSQCHNPWVFPLKQGICCPN
ncbi:hypothetical protein HPG69_012618 [Diceros bicornis minor]|uniref:Uncharacterized protein n=1 Tax=Diceros bicornis minor TaxID=77932 RepID=A0A7J7F9H9_DICBM|nr:hypothetical protein HPG69_012618 [Diceros bicornis minor]